ncbi:MAG: hypothetical protein IKE76_17365, partial [Clostridia bacterium]|nr:hypothetical protein [Clostridia bacterium]
MSVYLYRYRWQVELYFKRLKSILNYGELPKKCTHARVAGRAVIRRKLLQRTHNLCPNPGKPLIPGQPAGEHDVQLCIDLPPVSNR